jgi:signal transduction histidine kinase
MSMIAVFRYRRQTLALRNQQQAWQGTLQVERERLESVVGQRTAQLSELTHHLLTAREDERNRLARNLHDELGSLLTSAKLDAARIKSRLGDKAPETLELLAHLVETLNSGIALGRDIIEDLRPSALGNLGLVATLEILAREFAQHSGVEVECALTSVKLQASAEMTVYRLVQEAVTNITKYAQASHVWLSLATRDDQVEVSVRDDGIGFDTALVPRSAYGLLGMRFRVEAQGGTLKLVSAPGQGTLIEATMPISPNTTTP